METNKNSYIKFQDLDVYKLARGISKIAWEAYVTLDMQTKIIIGSQMVRSSDSVAANIAEGYGRFHFLDKIKFYYNARGSLYEFEHWAELLLERKLIDFKTFEEFSNLCKQLEVKLNNLISKTYQSKENNKASL